MVQNDELRRLEASARAVKIGGASTVHTARCERAWLLDRINSDADVTLRGLQAELAERGVVASYGAIWNFMHRQGLSHKKNRVRNRARSPGHRAKTGAMEKAPLVKI